MYEVINRIRIDNTTLNHITYEWDGESDTVLVIEQEENSPRTWSNMPRFENFVERSEIKFLDLPEEIKKALLRAKDTNNIVRLGETN